MKFVDFCRICLYNLSCEIIFRSVNLIIDILMYILYILLGIIGTLLLYVIFIIISSLFADNKKFYEKESKFFRFLLTSSTAVASVILRIRVRVNGKEKLPDCRFLLVSNHRSKFDPILTWLALGKYHISFISKYENFKVPVYGRIIRKCCFMGIDRENPRKAVETINQASKLLINDEVSVGVYPEGKRNFDEGLLPFHNMVFKIAIKANVPIVVTTVKGADKIHKNYPFHRSNVTIDIIDVISAEKVKKMKTNDIGNYVRELMINNLEVEK